MSYFDTFDLSQFFFLSVNNAIILIAHFLMSPDGSSFSPADARLSPWKILFIACGAVTACIGIVNFFFLPSTVMDAVWMKSPLKRAQALDRVKDEQLGTENHIVKVRSFALD